MYIYPIFKSLSLSLSLSLYVALYTLYPIPNTRCYTPYSIPTSILYTLYLPLNKYSTTQYTTLYTGPLYTLTLLSTLYSILDTLYSIPAPYTLHSTLHFYPIFTIFTTNSLYIYVCII